MSDPVRHAAAMLRALPVAESDAERIDQVRALEELKSVAPAAQARVTAAFVASQRAQQKAAGVPVARMDRGIPEQIGLARRISPHQAHRYTGWASILTTELPETFAALQHGEVSEWRAMIIARETIWLSRQHRAQVDAELAPKLADLGDRGVERSARAIAYRLDPHGSVNRLGAAAAERRVTLRAAPDAMARLSALLPVAQGVAAFAALLREADRVVGAGDARGHGQVMADTLVERLTGQARAGEVPVEINLVMTDRGLTGDDREPASLVGHGPVPGPVARALALDGEGPRWLRRLYAAPSSGALVAMESRRRRFTPGQRRFLRVRDQGACRTPYCDAPVRHIDHVVPHAEGGPTAMSNGRGTCRACNYAKQAPGWRTRARPDGSIVVQTPTTHEYAEPPPEPVGRRRGHGTDWSFLVVPAA